MTKCYITVFNVTLFAHADLQPSELRKEYAFLSTLFLICDSVFSLMWGIQFCIFWWRKTRHSSPIITICHTFHSFFSSTFCYQLNDWKNKWMNEWPNKHVDVLQFKCLWSVKLLLIVCFMEWCFSLIDVLFYNEYQNNIKNNNQTYK